MSLENSTSSNVRAGFQQKILSCKGFHTFNSVLGSAIDKVLRHVQTCSGTILQLHSNDSQFHSLVGAITCINSNKASSQVFFFLFESVGWPGSVFQLPRTFKPFLFLTPMFTLDWTQVVWRHTETLADPMTRGLDLFDGKNTLPLASAF